MRSPREITFRLRQEAANLALLARPPKAATRAPSPLAGLPDPDAVAARLRGTPYAEKVERLAERICAHRFPLLAIEIETGPEIDWRRDYASGRSTGLDYFRRIPYLDPQRAGDHKIIWELNRHQHLVLLAQAWRLAGRAEFLAEIEIELRSWSAANPYGRGINWASALEVGFRALSWIWVYHLAGSGLGAEARAILVEGIYAHGRYLERNLSIYFSPNTHLLGEAVALLAVGRLFPDYPGAGRWRRVAGAAVRAQMEAQVHADGSHFEQSSYYHVYAFDMLLFAAVLEEMPASYRERLLAMGDYLDSLLGPARRLPFLGDDDGGRFFHPYGVRDAFGRGSLAAASAVLGVTRWRFAPEDTAELAAWWSGGAAEAAAETRAESRLFPDAGIAVMAAEDVQVVADAGGFGEGSGGHSHSDTLAVVARRGGEEILVDAGTYTYVADAAAREWFRGSAAHNTLRIDGLDQAEPAGPFRWRNRPGAGVLAWRSTAERDEWAGFCEYRGFRHTRRVRLEKPGLVWIVDEIEGPAGDHLVEQFWHAGAETAALSPRLFRIGERARLALSHAAELTRDGEHGWRSTAFGRKEAAPAIRAAVTGALPLRLAAVLDCSGAAGEEAALAVLSGGW